MSAPRRHAAGQRPLAAFVVVSILAGTGACAGRGTPAAAPGAAPSPAPPRAAWTYDLADLAPADLAAALDRLARRGVTRLYLSVEDGPRFRLDDPPGRVDVARAARAAVAAGMEVHAMLLQDPRWLEDADGARRRVAAAAGFGAGPGERPFAGLHLDVEPHTLDAWECGGPEGRARLLARLAELVAAARGAARGPHGSSLPLSVAVPWWLFEAETADGAAAVRTLAAAVDEVVLMAYGEPGGPLVGGRADRLACRLRLPALLAALPAGPRLSVGLAGHEYPDPAALDATAARLDARFAAHARYGGTALFLDGGAPGTSLVVSLRGRVIDASGRPVDGAAVTAAPEGAGDRAAPATTTNACGRFLLRLSWPGAARLEVVAPGSRPGAAATLTLRGLVAGREREVGTIVVAQAAEREASGATRARPGGGSAPALPTDPALPPDAPLLARARALAAAREGDGARAAFEALLHRRPGNLEARLGLARLDTWQGRLDRAAGAYRAILADRCDAAEALLGLADLARRGGRLDEARRLYGEVARDWPHEPAGFVGLGRVAAALGRPAHAAGLAGRALALDPSDAEAQEIRARAREAGRRDGPAAARPALPE